MWPRETKLWYYAYRTCKCHITANSMEPLTPTNSDTEPKLLQCCRNSLLIKKAFDLETSTVFDCYCMNNQRTTSPPIDLGVMQSHKVCTNTRTHQLCWVDQELGRDSNAQNAVRWLALSNRSEDVHDIQSIYRFSFRLIKNTLLQLFLSVLIIWHGTICAN